MPKLMGNGLEYYPEDTTYTPPEKLLRARFGMKGVGILKELKMNIFRNGYFIPWSEDDRVLFARDTGEPIELIDEIVQAALRRGIFNETLFKDFSILTSYAIQEQWRFAVQKSHRKNTVIEAHFNLLEIKTQPPGLSAEAEKHDQNQGTFNFQSVKSDSTGFESDPNPVESTPKTHTILDNTRTGGDIVPVESDSTPAGIDHVSEKLPKRKRTTAEMETFKAMDSTLVALNGSRNYGLSVSDLSKEYKQLWLLTGKLYAEFGIDCTVWAHRILRIYARLREKAKPDSFFARQSPKPFVISSNEVWDQLLTMARAEYRMQQDSIMAYEKQQERDKKHQEARTASDTPEFQAEIASIFDSVKRRIGGKKNDERQ